MPTTDAILAALLDPFRIGLLLALFYTMLRTRAATGTLLPLAAGAIFVAIIIPVTMGQASGATLMPLVLAGLVANVILLAVILGLYSLWLRMRSAG